ncbi:hypothetical protein KR093_005219 [Drosophila rubida]|uniref:F-box domain-containing protein n=1 Tax=Drosophila rubida TaxID=30044 RepID=A0AAD4PKA8_9MUSC|nr:hypothetical protein KR093_005219 [Drosophila rubida]
MNKTENDCGILQLDEYCIEHILEYLEMEDHLNFAGTCNHFRLVFKLWAQRFYSNFILIGWISPSELKLLSLVNENVKLLRVDVDDLILSLNENYSKKRSYYFGKFRELFGGMQQLRRLSVWQFEYNNWHYAKTIIKDAASHQLQELEISADREQLSSLEKLRIALLDTTVNISTVYLDLIKTCTRLRLLSIFDLTTRESFAIQVSRLLEEFEDRRPLELFIYGQRESTITRTLENIDSSHLIYSSMNAEELIQLM